MCAGQILRLVCVFQNCLVFSHGQISHILFSFKHFIFSTKELFLNTHFMKWFDVVIFLKDLKLDLNVVIQHVSIQGDNLLERKSRRHHYHELVYKDTIYRRKRAWNIITMSQGSHNAIPTSMFVDNGDTSKWKYMTWLVRMLVAWFCLGMSFI